MTTASHSIPRQPPDPRRLAIHTITTKPWSLQDAISNYARHDVGGISVWVEALEATGADLARRMLDDAGLKVPALVRGGFFCDPSQVVRDSRIDHNRRLLEQAAVLGAEMLVLVVGATPGTDLSIQRGWVRDGIEHLLGDAEKMGIQLAIEPLHPMYAADKSCINQLSQARRICEAIDHLLVGVAVDVYHVWWDACVLEEIATLGQSKRIFAFHLCDWRVPTRDLLNDRALMGEGCIDIKSLRQAVDAAGFTGWNEVEIFSNEWWEKDQHDFLLRIKQAYEANC